MLILNTYENSPYKEQLSSKKLKPIIGKLGSSAIKKGRVNYLAIKEQLTKKKDEVEDEKEIAHFMEYMQRKIYEQYKQQLLVETKRNFANEIEKRFAKSESNKTYVFPRKIADDENEEKQDELNSESLNETVINLNDQNMKHFRRSVNHSTKKSIDSKELNSSWGQASFETTTAGLQNRIKNRMIQESGKADLFKTSFKGAASKIIPNTLKNIITPAQEDLPGNQNPNSLPQMRASAGKFKFKESAAQPSLQKKEANNRYQGPNARKKERNASGYEDYEQYYRSLVVNGANWLSNKTFEEGKNLDTTVETRRTVNLTLTNTSYQSTSVKSSQKNGLASSSSSKFLTKITPRNPAPIEGFWSKRPEGESSKQAGLNSTNMKIESKKQAVSVIKGDSWTNSMSISSLMMKVNKVHPIKLDKIEDADSFLRKNNKKDAGENHKAF